MNRSFRWAAPLLVLATAATTTRAQDQGQTPDVQRNAGPPAAAPAAASAPVAIETPAVRAPQPGPTTDRATAGVRVSRNEPAALPPAPRRADTNRNKAMMIVGAAGLIVGAIIGDTPGTLIMVGGAVLGLYGLYKYLE